MLWFGLGDAPAIFTYLSRQLFSARGFYRHRGQQHQSHVFSGGGQPLFFQAGSRYQGDPTGHPSGYLHGATYYGFGRLVGGSGRRDDRRTVRSGFSDWMPAMPCGWIM